MIEFNGDITGNCKKYMLKRSSNLGRMAGLTVAILFGIPAIIISIVWDWIFIISLPVLVLFVFLAGARPDQKTHSSILPNKVSITSKNKIISESEVFHYTRSIVDVKEIVDFGEWYHIFFYFEQRNGHFVCQKNLLSKGSIDEFEKLFEGKIIRKNNKIHHNS